MLEPVSTRIEQVQVALASIVGVRDILIGHSLENDLRALCLVHDKVVDTALLFRTESGARKHCKHDRMYCTYIILVFNWGSFFPFALTCFILLDSVGSSQAPIVGSTQTKDPSRLRLVGSLFRGRRVCGSFACPQSRKDRRLVSAFRPSPTQEHDRRSHYDAPKSFDQYCRIDRQCRPY